MNPGFPRADREFTFLSPMPFDVVARDIPEDEYEALPDKLVMVPL